MLSSNLQAQAISHHHVYFPKTSRSSIRGFLSPFKSLAPGEGNGNPLQYSCLENPRDGGAWWAAVYGVAQSWTRLKRLSSSSILTEALGVGPVLGNKYMLIHLILTTVQKVNIAIPNASKGRLSFSKVL